jgi:hypothetical protein
MIKKRSLIGIAVILFLMMFGCGTVTSPTSAPTTTSTHTYVGSANSSIYHYPSCASAKKIKEANEVWFSDVAEAKDSGYVPCKVCRPPTQ